MADFLNQHMASDFDDAGAIAIARVSGRIETADERFLALMALEWGATSLLRVPASVMACWQRAQPYTGRTVTIVMRRCNGYLLLKARQHAPSPRLTARETVVARLFASGLSHPQIAIHLGVSKTTVRTHLAHVYDKLAVHTKIALARRISGVGFEPDGMLEAATDARKSLAGLEPFAVGNE